MNIIRIVDIVGSPDCTVPEDARKVLQAITNALRETQQVTISFSGVEDLTPRFLIVAIGQLYSEFPRAELKAKLRVVEISQDDLALLKRVVERAREFFLTKSSKLDEIIRDEPELLVEKLRQYQLEM